MKLLATSIVLFTSGWFFAQESIDSIYSNGMLNGHYESFYSNGIKKASGDFVNNQRVGEWKLWDSTGVLRMQRTYEDNLNFEIELALSPEGNHIPDLEGYTHKNERPKTGLLKFDFVEEADVAISKRLWRRIDANDLHNDLFTIVMNDVIEHDAKVYHPSYDDLRERLADDSVAILEDKQAVAYKIKEDWFYDKKRHLAEIRMIGVCPVAEIDGRERDLFWVFYPHLRKILIDEGINDDQLVLRNFKSTIIKESNVNDRSLADYEEDLEKANRRIAAELIDMEHDQWLNELK